MTCHDQPDHDQPDHDQAASHRFDHLLAAVLAVGSDVDLPVLLRQLVEIAVNLVGARSATLTVTEAAGPRRRHVISVGAGPLEPGPLEPGPLGPAQLEPTLLVPVVAGTAVLGSLSLSGPLGDPAGSSPTYSEQDRRLVEGLATAAAVAAVNAGRRDESRRSAAWMEAGRDISTALLSGTEPEDVIALVVDRVHDVLQPDVACVVFTRGADLHVEAASGLDAQTLLGPLTSTLRSVLSSGRPREVTLEHYVGTAVPLGPSDRHGHGALLALWRHRPDPSVIVDLTGFGAQAAVALELAERRREAERSAIAQDRNRIGRDLHDLVIQRLFATGMQLQSAVRLIEQQPTEASARVNRAVDELDATIRELRSTIYGLQAPLTALPSLRARVGQLVDGATEQLGFTPTLQLDGLLDTLATPEIAEHALATLREALSNVVRHGRAHQVGIVVALRDDTLTVQVFDDGVGLAGSGPHSGLRNLQERAVQLGGALQLTDRAGGGTHLVWAVPL